MPESVIQVFFLLCNVHPCIDQLNGGFCFGRGVIENKMIHGIQLSMTNAILLKKNMIHDLRCVTVVLIMHWRSAFMTHMTNGYSFFIHEWLVVTMTHRWLLWSSCLILLVLGPLNYSVMVWCLTDGLSLIFLIFWQWLFSCTAMKVYRKIETNIPCSATAPISYPASSSNFPNGCQGHPQFYPPPDRPPITKPDSNCVQTRCSFLFNYWHGLT
jgi:hypothetical protein